MAANHVVFLCRHPSKLERVASHLKKANYQPQVFTSLKQAIAFMLKEQPKHIFVSWTYNSEPKKFLKALNKTFSTECIPFAESGDRIVSTSLSKSGFRDIVLYPVSGDSIQRIIERRTGAAAETQKKEQQTASGQSLSKIQIRVTAEDVPLKGQWEVFPGKQNTWLYKTDEPTRMSGKKNGRFVYTGDKMPERKQNGSWNIDTKRGKLDFEILNVVEEGKVLMIDTQAKPEYLTESEAIDKISKALGKTIEQIETEMPQGFSEEEIFNDEITQDVFLPTEDVDSAVGSIIHNLETGFLEEEERKIKLLEEEKERKKREGLHEEDDEDGGVSLHKGKKQNNGGTIFQEREQENDGSTLQEGEEADFGHSHLKGEKLQKGKLVSSEAEEKSSGLMFGDRAEEVGDVYQTKDQDESTYKRAKGVIPPGKYKPKIDGNKSELAVLLHAQNLNLKKGANDEELPTTPVEMCTRVGIITIISKIYNGYFVCATGGDKKPDLDRLEQVREAITDKMMAEGHGPRDLLVAEIDIPEINFKDWAERHASFISLAKVKTEEVAIAFLDARGRMPDESLSKSSEMLKIPFNSVVPDTILDFDFYLFLPKNDKFILYVKRHDTYSQRQYSNLEKSNVQEGYIRSIHLDQYKIYCAKMYVWSKIKEKQIKKVS